MFAFSKQMELLAMAVRHHEYVDSGSGFALSCGLEKLFAKLDNSGSGKTALCWKQYSTNLFPLFPWWSHVDAGEWSFTPSDIFQQIETGTFALIVVEIKYQFK